MRPRRAPDLFDAAEVERLRRERARLLSEAHRHRYRLHRLTGLTAELRDVTTRLMALEARRPAETPTPDPAGERRDPYRWWDR